MAERKIPTIEELEAHSRDRAALYRLGEGLIRNRFSDHDRGVACHRLYGLAGVIDSDVNQL